MRIWGMVKGIGLALMLAGPLAAQEFSGLARLDAGQSRVEDSRRGVEIDLALSQPVPWRVFTLDDPRRLVLDFAEVDWAGADPAALLSKGRATALRLGRGRPGWSRLVLDLGAPMGIDSAGMRALGSGAARLQLRLSPVTEEEFAARARPADPAGEMLPAPARPGAGPLVVAVDAGHGGVDPGAMREGLVEADLMLRLARETAEAINRSGNMRAVLTRDSDDFVPLSERMTIARAAGAGLLLSLHADALEEDAASGGSVYTLSDAAKDAASGRMVERHQRSDLLSGLDLSQQDDRVATALMDLARLDTAPQSDRLAGALVAALRQAGAHLNSRPRRSAPLAVLNAADFPSVLVEVGFLSNAGDRARLTDPAGRARIVAGLVAGVQGWAAEEAARAPLRRR